MSGEREPLLRHAGTSGRSRGYRSAMSPIERNGDDIEFTEISVPERFNMKQYVKKCCTLEAVKGKLPITKWLPKYS
jgi:hypothetical protein